jgi:IS1 family transposase/transposase-like protein
MGQDNQAEARSSLSKIILAAAVSKGNAVMIAPLCSHSKQTKHGKDRKGNQRWKCALCGITITEDKVRPLGDMRIDMDKAIPVLRMLLEGMSIRAAERITGMKRDTICDLVLTVGANCDRLLQAKVTNVQADYVELDEMWGFVGCKAKTATAKHYGPELGDAWTWLAIDAQSKLILSHVTGKRDESTCHTFLKRLNAATVGQMQVTSDGLSMYTYNVPFYLGSRIDFAQLVKSYSNSTAPESRYSPATIVGIEKVSRFGTPSEEHVSTSYSERLNLSLRMHIRRLTRLTNAHSKSFAHHSAMISLFVAYYNFCRKHDTLKGKTPAMAGNLSEKPWTIVDLLENAAK